MLQKLTFTLIIWMPYS